jgi:hypothetical protein
MRTYTHGSRCRGQSRTLNKRRGSRNRESKNFMKSLRESLRGTPEVEIMEEEAGSEVEAEDEDLEAGASRCLAGRNDFFVAVLRSSVALVVWYPTMDCICTNSFLLENFLIEPRPC